jgi:hypothetical protein
MTDLQTKKTIFAEARVDLPFMVNEFQRVQIPPKTRTDEKEFHQMANAQQQKMMERLIDCVKEL